MGKKILVIDEDKKTAGLFGKALEPKGFDVYAIAAPDKGIEKAIEIEPDLIFVDLMFQESNGLKVSKLLHAVDKLKKVPIIMLISHRSDLDPKYTSTIGVVDVLLQPFTTEDIISRTFSVLGADAGVRSMEAVTAELAEEEDFEAFAELAPDEHEFVSEADKLIDQAILKNDGEKKKISGREDSRGERDVIHLRRPGAPEKSVGGPVDHKMDEETVMEEKNLFDEPEETRDHRIKRPFEAEPDYEEELHSQSAVEDPEDFDDEEAEEEQSGTKKKILMAVAGLVVIAGLGVGAYQIKKSFFSDVTGKPPAATAPARTETVKDSLPPSDQVKPAETPGTAPAPTANVPSVPAPQQEARAVPPPAAPAAGTAGKETAVKEPAPAPKIAEKPKAAAAPPAEKKEPATAPKETKKEAVQAKADFKFSVQAGYFENEKNAESAAGKLKGKGYEAFVLKGTSGAKTFYRVLIGRFDNSKKAEAQAKTIKQKEGIKVVIFRG